MKNFLNKSVGLYSVMLLAIIPGACTNYLDPEPVYEEYELPEDTTSVTRKVLVISIDGLVGNELKKDVPPTIAGLLEHSKYSFESIADENTSDPASWATMMTGVGHSKHGINSESYLPAPDPSDPHHSGDYYPSIFYRIAEHDPQLVTTAITQATGLANILLMDAGQSFVEDNDEKAKEKAVEQLTENNPDLLMVQFTSVLEAGKESSFSFDSPRYKEAVQQVDSYIGELKKATESRDRFNREEWLIVVTSNHGGLDNDYGGGSFQERNTFTLFHHQAFVGQELRANVMSYIRHWGYDGTENRPLGVRSTSEDMGDNSVFDLATSRELTIESKIKFNLNNTIIGSTYAPGTYQYWYSGIFGKDASTADSSPGWMYYTWGNDLEIRVSDGSKLATARAGRINGEWYHLTVVIQVVDNDAVRIKMFNNGNLVAETTTDGMNVANIKTLAPLIFGYRPSISYDLVDFELSDIRIWDKALNDNEVREVACLMEMPTDYPLISNLKGLWKMSPNSNGEMPNEIDGSADMIISGEFQPRITQYFIPCETDDSEILVQAVDLMPQVLYWLHINVRDSWGIEGQNFLKNFELEFLN